MPLTKQDVAGIADYARIALTDAELDEMTAYLNDAIALLDPILEYELDDVEPTFHPIGELVNVVRDDVMVAGLPLEEALANASSRRGRSFRVPAILVDGGVA
ncbi:MAG: Asp-tRNA(Asn)/Glu-tRNA(Gln) amidotransferase subunit GatC [Acidobacteriota bacterium]|nr:Asp-tRNA(Asn)/Glu-tRNA(Gln) amidotransferase subunit GatC [Acidobacteriota bacterium]